MTKYKLDKKNSIVDFGTYITSVIKNKVVLHSKMINAAQVSLELFLVTSVLMSLRIKLKASC